jgi:hypothetical protein
MHHQVPSISGGLGSCPTKNFGTAGAVPSKFSPNKFGAQKIRHQPPAKAIVVMRKI